MISQSRCYLSTCLCALFTSFSFFLLFSHPLEAAIAEKTEIGLTEIEEGEEPEVFWMALGGKEDYGSLLASEIIEILF